MDAAIIQSGSFTSTGAAQTLQIRSDFDWIKVYNYTKSAGNGTAVTGSGFSFYWQFGMPIGGGIFTGKAAAAATLVQGQIAANAGFTPVDSAGNPLGAAIATTEISGANPPLISTATTPQIGQIVRLYSNTDAREVNGYDFSVKAVDAGNTFTLGGAFNAAVNGNGVQDGFYRVINYDPLYYPRSRYIMNIVKGATTVVTTSIPSGYVKGQAVRFIVPSQFGTIELNGQVGTITDVNDALATQTITVAIDSTNYTTFTFPTNAAYPFSPAMVVPVGENTAYAIQQAQNILSDATYNTGYIGVILASGANSPAGAAGDVIYWVAGKSSYTQNP